MPNEKWEGDVLQRKTYADFLTGMLENQTRPVVLNLNAPWGSGKTFFIQHWYEDVIRHHPAALFNAWETDFSNDPLLAFLSCIQEQLSTYLPKKKASEHAGKLVTFGGRFFRNVAPAIIKGLTIKAIGEDGYEAFKDINAEDEKSIGEVAKAIAETAVVNHAQTQSAIIEFKKEVTKIINEIVKRKKVKAPFFIFVDELDRCRPTYAIETLENIKHLFGIPNVVFVVATDKKQLASSTKSIYGETFDSENYLGRFFDREYALPLPNYAEFAALLVKEYEYPDNDSAWADDIPHLSGSQKLKWAFATFSEYFELELRQQQQAFSRLHAIKSTLPDKEKLFLPFILFLIMAHFKLPQIFFECLDTQQSLIKMPLREKDLNLKLMNSKVTVNQLISQFHTASTITDELKRHDNLSLQNNVVYRSIMATVWDNPQLKIRRYPEKVLLAGALF